MKRTFTVVYTIFVIIALLTLAGWNVWNGRTIQKASILRFMSLADVWVRDLGQAVLQDRDIEKEKSLARSFLLQEPRLEAVQIYSHDKGLRLSVVSTKESALAEELAETALVDSKIVNKTLMKIRFTTINRPLDVPGMPGLDVDFVIQTLGREEFRSLLSVDLIVVVGLFLTTLLLIVVSSQISHQKVQKDQKVYSSDLDDVPEDELTLDSDGLEGNALDSEEDEFFISDDLESSPAEDQDFPDFDKEIAIQEDIFEDPSSDENSALRKKLDQELERSALAQEDLVLVLIKDLIGLPNKEQQDFVAVVNTEFDSEELVFPYEDGGMALILLDVSLKEAVGQIENFLRDWQEKSGRSTSIAGLSSRNQRTIASSRFIREAKSALSKADQDNNIVAFQSDPKKFEDFLANTQD